MYLDKVKQFWTEEDRAKFDALNAKHLELVKNAKYIKSEDGKGSVADPVWNDQLEDVFDEITKLEEEVDQRYYDSLKSKEALYSDIKDVIEAIEKKDFQGNIASRKELLADTMNNEEWKKRPGGKQMAEQMKQRTIENYENCCDYILLMLIRQLEALHRLYPGEPMDRVYQLIDRQASKWYQKPAPDFLPMAHGRATDALAFMSSKNAVTDPISQTALIKSLGVELAIQKFEELHTSLGISTDKLLSYATAIFTQQNDFRNQGDKEPNRFITIPLKEYASRLGYDVTEHQTETEEERKKEKRRAKTQLDNARKAIKKDLDLLHASTLTWEEKIKGKPNDFMRVSLVTQSGIKNGEIQIAFSPEFAGYLTIRNLITQYPTKLLKISGRAPNAYYIGRKLSEHYYIDNNQIKGTYNRIGIASLLAITDLPSYEEVQKTDRGHWERRIKEPLEQALDLLTKEDVLDTWEYVHPKGLPLTDEEAVNLTDYRDYERLLLHFELADAKGQADRIRAKRDSKKKA